MKPGTDTVAAAGQSVRVGVTQKSHVGIPPSHQKVYQSFYDA